MSERSILTLPILELSDTDSLTLADGCAGIVIFGAIGSGKTSGSGQAIARARRHAPDAPLLASKGLKYMANGGFTSPLTPTPPALAPNDTDNVLQSISQKNTQGSYQNAPNSSSGPIWKHSPALRNVNSRSHHNRLVRSRGKHHE